MKTKWMMSLTEVLLVMGGTVTAADKEADSEGEWFKLFADEGWYKQQPGKEQVFRGKLESVQPPQASTLMRSAVYRVEGRAVYTGGRKVASLNKLVGSEIEIRGKAVDMHMEGQAVGEVWPAFVRGVNEAKATHGTK